MLFAVPGCTESAFVLLVQKGGEVLGWYPQLWVHCSVVWAGSLPGAGGAGLHPQKKEKALCRLSGVLQGCAPDALEYLSVALNPCQ